MLTESHTTSESAWARIATASFIDLEVHSAVDEFEASLRSTTLGDTLRLSSVHNSASTISRTARGYAADGNTDLLLLTPISGTVCVQQGGSKVALRPGEYSIHFANEPYALEYPESSEVLVLQTSAGTVQLPHRFPAGLQTSRSAVGTVLRSLITDVLDTATPLSMHEHEVLQDTAISLMSTMLLRTVGVERTESSKLALVLRAQAFARAHLADPELSPAQVAAKFHVSLRYLQLAFAESGESFSAFLERERLDRATQLLTDPQFAQHALVDIAAACGYELNTFIRAFKRRTGETPGAYRNRILIASTGITK